MRVATFMTLPRYLMRRTNQRKYKQRPSIEATPAKTPVQSTFVEWRRLKRPHHQGFRKQASN